MAKDRLLCGYLAFGLFFATIVWNQVQSDDINPKCGYQSCPVSKPDMINVHLICHTHDDVGWVRTVDEYYDGSNWVTVKKIINSVVEELPKGPDRKFIYVETSFFWKWWQQQPEEKQSRVRKLVESGQLEFVGGGWCMNDEATALYSDIIDQMTLGLRKLRQLFGQCGVPRVVWQIDPFGHSREQASLFAQMGFDGLFIGRIHYKEKVDRLQNKNMEFIWNASANLGPQSQLFTGALYDEYSAPHGFCFDAVCSDYNIDDDFDPNNNVPQRVSQFLNVVKNQSQYYATNNVLVTMGGDFTYVDADKWFRNLDKLIYYTNKMQKNGSKVNIMYSTPSCYLKALHDSKQSWPVKNGDFFPYASDVHTYWTGYFTSRPYLKRLVRKSTNILQTCRQLHFIGQEFSNVSADEDDLFVLEDALSIAQHHDAVSGTAKQYVTDDYMHRLEKGISKCRDIISNAYKNLISTNVSHCPNLDVNECDITEISKKFTVTLYNPLARPIEHLVRIPVHSVGYKVLGPNGEKIPSQLTLVSSHLLSLPKPVHVTAVNELVFTAKVPAVGFSTYFVQSSMDADTGPGSFKPVQSEEDVILSNDKIQVIINGMTGLLESITDLENNIKVPVSQNFYYYNAVHDFHQSSGAYIFRPNETKNSITNTATLTRIVKGPCVDEVHQVFNGWISQIIRLPKNAQHVEFEWTVGPIDLDDIDITRTWQSAEGDSGGKEVVTFFQTGLETNEEFYTDANGREIIRRRLNTPSMLGIEEHEPVAGNYYPVNTRIFIQDEKQDVQVTLLTDRSVGGSSLLDGSLEIMLHRRLLYDDGKGVEESLSEFGMDKRGLVVRGKTLLLVDPIAKAARHHRQLAQELLFSPFVSFTNDSTSSWNKWSATNQTQFSSLARVLPPNVHLLTLEALKKPYVLVRLEHFYEDQEDTEMSKPANVDLNVLFNRSTIISVEETVLSANQPLDKVKRFYWMQNGQESSAEDHTNMASSLMTDNFVIELKPMQIRTFVVELGGSWTSSAELGFQ